MTLHHLVFNPYEVNTFIVAAADGQCAIVDPSCCSPAEQATLKKFIADKELRPTWLINTHGHFDHVIGNAFVCKTWPVKTAAHRGDLFLMENAYRQGEIFGFSVEQPPTPEVFLNDGDTVAFDNVTLQVYHIPGHSPGSIVLSLPGYKLNPICVTLIKFLQLPGRRTAAAIKINKQPIKRLLFRNDIASFL